MHFEDLGFNMIYTEFDAGKKKHSSWIKEFGKLIHISKWKMYTEGSQSIRLFILPAQKHFSVENHWVRIVVNSL